MGRSDHLVSGHLDRLAGARIAPDPGRALLDLEVAETVDADLVTLLQGAGDGIEEPAHVVACPVIAYVPPSSSSTFAFQDKARESRVITFAMLSLQSQSSAVMAEL